MKPMNYYPGNEYIPETPDENPVRSLVQVKITGGPTLTYYNDLFDLHIGDYVFVSGRYAGKHGRITSVNTRFRIRLSDYQKVLRKLNLTIHGHFSPIPDGSYIFSGADCTISPEQVRSWLIPPRPKHIIPDDEILLPAKCESGDEDIIVGDGYEFPLSELEKQEELTPEVLERGMEYYKQHRVMYLSVCGEHVTAFVNGSEIYEPDFCFDRESRIVTELYCDCPYPSLCKHTVAIMLLLRELLNLPEVQESEDFTVLEENFFSSTLRMSHPAITL